MEQLGRGVYNLPGAKCERPRKACLKTKSTSAICHEDAWNMLARTNKNICYEICKVRKLPRKF